MDRNHLFSMALTAATLGLTACGGSNDVASTTTGGGTSTTAPITPAAVACTAPDVSEIASGPYVGSDYASVCIPNTDGSGSSRYDVRVYGTCSGSRLSKMDFTDAACTTGASESASVSGRIQIASNTTTVASLAADGVTPVTGSGRTVSFTVNNYPSGTFPAGVPLVTNGIYTLCKTTPPSTTTTRITYDFNGGGDRQFTPAFVLRSSNADTNAINTALGFEGNGAQFDYYE
jgi:hypothetical protein